MATRRRQGPEPLWSFWRLGSTFRPLAGPLAIPAEVLTGITEERNATLLRGLRHFVDRDAGELSGAAEGELHVQVAA